MNNPIIPKPNKDCHILAVDDTPNNLMLIKAMLAPEGYKITLAQSGRQALVEIVKFLPDLILLDIMMPDMDGFEVTRRIRNDPNLPFIPILLITAYDKPSVVTGLDAGADDFIKKPVSIDELLARVRSLLRLKHSVDERDAIARQREDFVSRLTHDLRTPLVAADRMLNLMQEGILGEPPPQMREVITTMIRSNQNLLVMVNTLLEVYRYEAGAKTLYFSAVNTRKLIQEVVEEVKPLSDLKNVPIVCHWPPDIPLISGDRLELHRVFTNLLGNAIKFTDSGQITVQASLAEDGEAIDIKFHDTGRGISPENQQIIFNRFRTGSDRAAGFGLGLHLCKIIVEAHQGNISVSSELGVGSTFTVHLPINQPKV
jgi:signal transduction histidine kinase